MHRIALVLLVCACGKSSSTPAKQEPAQPGSAAADALVVAVDAGPPVPDVKAYAKALEEAHACKADDACFDAAIDRALAIWPESPSTNLWKARRLEADPAKALPFAKRALEVLERDERISALELAAGLLEKTGDRDGAIAAYSERLALRGDYELQKRVEKLAGKPLSLARDPAMRLGGPVPSVDFYCEALAAENPSLYGGTHCLPKCAGVDEGPTTASASGWRVELVASIRETHAVAGSVVSCDLLIGKPGAWYVLREAATCAPCGHAPFPETTPLLEVLADPKLKGRGNYDYAPRHDAASSEELAFRDVVPGGAPELVWRMRSRTIWVGGYSEDYNHITRDDTRTVIVCGMGASGRWSCLPERPIAADQEMVPIGKGAPKPERTAWHTTLSLENGKLELSGDPKHAASIPLAFP